MAPKSPNTTEAPISTLRFVLYVLQPRENQPLIVNWDDLSIANPLYPFTEYTSPMPPALSLAVTR